MCEKSGFKFIGPTSETIQKMGDKITAKTLAEKSGIQIVPGYKDEIPSDNDEIKKIMIKRLVPVQTWSKYIQDLLLKDQIY